MLKHSLTFFATAIMLVALISFAQAETFQAKVVLADKPDVPVADAAVRYYGIGKQGWSEGDAKTNEKGEFKVSANTTDLLVLVFNKEGTHSTAAVLTPKDEATLKLTPGKPITCGFSLNATGDEKQAAPIADLSLSLCLLFNDKGGNARLRMLPDFFQKIKTNADGKVTFANLPEKPEQEDMPEFGYYLLIHKEMMVNGVKCENQMYYRPIDSGQDSSQFVIRPSDLQVDGWYLMNFIFDSDHDSEPPQQPDTLLGRLAAAFGGGNAPKKEPRKEQEKKQLLLIFNPGKPKDAIFDGDEEEGTVCALLSLLFYDPEISPVFKKYHVRGIRTSGVRWEKKKGTDDEYIPKVVEDKANINYIKKLDKSLEKLGLITFCVLDEKGKHLITLPYENVTGKTFTKQGEETESVLPDLLLPFLEAFAE